MNKVMLEALRFQNPANNGMPMMLVKDSKIGNYNIKANDELIINYQGVQKLATQWQRPQEFLPDRFDSEDPLYLTPSGEKRHHYVFVPFSGGKRICFGKSFAEATMKMTLTYLTQYFNFEHADACFGKDTDLYPQAHFGVSCRGFEPIHVILTENKE